MKKFIVLFLIVVFYQNVIAQESKGIDFVKNLSWKQAIEKAENENKLIFVDLYTTWCKPCKRLELEIFPLASVGEKFNKEFVSIRIDAEKGEGVDLAKKFRVAGYPYLVFTNSSGEMVFSTLGYKSENDMLAAADKAIGESKSEKPFAVWDGEYESRHTDKVWLKSYIQKRNVLRLDNRKFLQDYYAMLKPEEYLKTENLQLIIASTGLDLDSDLFRLISENFNKIPKEEDDRNFLQSGLIGIYDGAINSVEMPAIKENDETIVLTKVAPLYEELWPEKVNGMPWYEKHDGDLWKFIFYRETKNIAKFIPVAERYLHRYYFKDTPAEIKKKDVDIFEQSKIALSKQGMDPKSEMIKQMLGTYYTNDHMDRLVGASYLVLENTTDKDTLKIALHWAVRAKEINPSVATYEINARILNALDNRSEAVSNLENAIKVSQSDEEKGRLQKMLVEMK